MILSNKDQLSLKIQNWINAFNAFWFGPLFILLFILIGRYKCENLKQTRKTVSEIYRQNKQKPIIICSNHLTMIDSMLLTWFLFPLRKIITGNRYFPWNVPEIRNFGQKFLLKAMCYLGKCVFVERQSDSGGSRNHKSISKLAFLLSINETICLFPEGGRSRSGRIEPDQCSYGVGTLMEQTGIRNILVVYIRGKSQENFSFYPKKKEVFKIDVSYEPFHTEFSGKRASKDLTLKIMNRLKQKEDIFFADSQ